MSALLRVTFDPTTQIEPLTIKGVGDLPETVARYLHRLNHTAVRVDYAETFMTGAAFAAGRLLATFDVAQIGGVR
ncbi:hypothetical protein ABT071_13660 [Streptomyces sp. NPDC002506]|uniref:hypothetical protein n=1 Tax=Streptomyces sp. NPDC002506 TaxID=3154536 RepID=UPI003333768A